MIESWVHFGNFSWQEMEKIISWLGATTTILSLIAATGLQAHAGTLHNTWNYALDSFNDGVSGGQVGGGLFEFYGMAIKEDADQIFVAFNANLPLEGAESDNVANGSISWGDLFFNFSGQDFRTASANSNLWGIRFAQANDSGGTTLGVYSHVTAKNVSQFNDGFPSLKAFNSRVQSAGGTPSLGNLSADDSYFEQEGEWTLLNEIDTGTKVGDITWLGTAELLSAGLNFGHFGASGTQTIGFSLSKDLLPQGTYISSVFAECINDGMALKGGERAKSVPESSSVLSLFIFGTIGVGLQLRRK